VERRAQEQGKLLAVPAVLRDVTTGSWPVTLGLEQRGHNKQEALNQHTAGRRVRASSTYISRSVALSDKRLDVVGFTLHKFNVRKGRGCQENCTTSRLAGRES
jgi:hypothetical protein